MLASLGQQLGYDRAAQTDLVFLYVAYYNLPSALIVTEEAGASWPAWGEIDRWLKLPTGTERRAHRSPRRLAAHLVALDRLREAYGGLDRWVQAHCPGPGSRANWRSLQAALRTIDGNGRWAAYKTGEILAFLGWPATPTDAGHDFSSGPRHGLALVHPDGGLEGHTADVVARLDVATEEVRRAVSEHIGQEVPVEQLETALCDWASTVAGRYYIGHDIDQQLEQAALAPGLSQAMHARVLEARGVSFDRRWRGEVEGWAGVRKDLRSLWRERQELVWW